MTTKLRAGILGATGVVGQRFIQLLEHHPQFEVTALAASDRSQGKDFAEACTWRLPGEMPERVKQIVVQPPEPPLDCDFVFSSLPGEVAKDAEENFASAGYPVISNSSSHRMAPDVPLLIPEVNYDHVALIDAQRKIRRYDRGFIVTNPNCSAIVIVQALSGAGYPGVASLDATDNVIPFIGGEEEKIEAETLKLLGVASDGSIENASIEMSAQCNRVNVTDGHMASIRVKLKTRVSINEIQQ